MNGFTFNPERRMWYSPQDGGLWYEPSTGEFLSERYQVWTVLGKWPASVAAGGLRTPERPPAKAAPAANGTSWSRDPMREVYEEILALPRLDRSRLLRQIILELDEPDDKASFEEFADRVRRYGVDLWDRDAVYRLYRQSPPDAPGASGAATGGLERTIRSVMDMIPADGTTPRPYILGARR